MSFKGKGFVYILSNPSFPSDLLKIGMTRRSVKERANELYNKASGIPGPFKIEFEVQVSNCIAAEEIIHQRLTHYRNSHTREFFKLPLEDAIKIVLGVATEINSLYSKPAIKTQDDSTRFDEIVNQEYKSILDVPVSCHFCKQTFSVTLTRYELIAVCPYCNSNNRLNINW